MTGDGGFAVAKASQRSDNHRPNPPKPIDRNTVVSLNMPVPWEALIPFGGS